MSTPTNKIFITVKQRQIGDPALDQCYLCSHRSMPIDFEQDIFVLEDTQNRTWFCYELNMRRLSKKELGKIAHNLLLQYTPRTVKELIKLKKKPLVISIVAVRASSMRELEELLGEVKFVHSGKPKNKKGFDFDNENGGLK